MLPVHSGCGHSDFAQRGIQPVNVAIGVCATPSGQADTVRGILFGVKNDTNERLTARFEPKETN
jgi:hypothetical protein